MATDYESEFKIGSKGRLVSTEAKTPVETKIYPNVQFAGLDNLKPFQCELIAQKVNKFYQKVLENYFGNVTYFLVSIKLHEKKKVGKQKYSIHLRLALPSKVFSSEYTGFDVDTPISRAVEALDKELIRFREKTRERRTDFGKGRKKVLRAEEFETEREEKFEGIKERKAKVRLRMRK